MKSLLTIALGALAIAAWPLHAAEKKNAPPKDLPPYGELKPTPPPQVTQFKLDNGLTVWLAHEPGFPKVAFTLAIRGGYSADPKDRPGMSDLIAAVVTQGTRTRSARQVAEEMQACGGDLNADEDADAITVATSVLAEKADRALEILGDIAQNATFADHEVEIAKNNAKSGLEAAEANPQFLATRALRRAMFGDDPYAIVAPTQASIAAVTAAELRREYARRFRPDEALLIATGDFDESALRNAAAAAFGKWQRPGEEAPANVEKPSVSISRTVLYVPRAGSVQTTFLMGTLGPDRTQADFAAARVANAIYGGMFGSRLTLNIREDKGYTYSPYSSLQSMQRTGLLDVGAAVRNPVTGASFNEISYELNRMATTVPEEDELASAKRYVIGTQAISLQSRESLARSLARMWISGLPPEELGLQSTKVEKVTAADVAAAGKKYFPAWRMTVVAVGEEKVIRDELAPFGLEFRKAE